jgi:hypothetical protein
MGMRRVLLVIAAFLCIGGIILAWWFLRDTPEKVLRDGFGKLLNAKTAASVIAEIAWTDPNTRVTTGFGAAGQLDVKDLGRPRALGVIRLAEREGRIEETADVIIELDRFAIRPRSVTPESRARYQDLVGDPEGVQFAVIARDPFLNGNNWSQAIAQGETETIRSTVKSFPSVIAVAGPWKREIDRISVPFRIDGEALKPFLSATLQAWANDSPTPQDLVWMNRVATGLARGQFSLTINRQTREPMTLQGEWSDLNEKGEEMLRYRIRFDISGLNRSVNIAIPENAKDITDKLVVPKATGGLRPATLRTLPSATTGTGVSAGLEWNASGTYDLTPGNVVNEDDVDLFHKYLEDLKRQKSGG